MLGAAGFLGSHVTRRLVAQGRDVIAVDNLCTGRWSNLDGCNGTGSVVQHEHDVRDPFDFGAVDVVYNFACPASPLFYQAHPVETTLTNVVGMYNALQVGHRHGARVFQASTSEVYGDPLVHP